MIGHMLLATASEVENTKRALSLAVGNCVICL